MNNLLSRITVNPAICHGKPTIRGLRYPVQIMLELMSSGMTIEELLDDYPDLEKEDSADEHQEDSNFLEMEEKIGKSPTFGGRSKSANHF